MNRKIKLCINLCLITSFIIGYLYYNGYYISQEKCLTDQLETLYSKDYKKEMELMNGNITLTLFSNPKELTYTVLGTKKVGVLYKQIGSHQREIDTENSFDYYYCWNEEYGLLMLVYRNDPTIAKVELTDRYGEVYLFETWNNHFSGILIDDKEIKTLVIVSKKAYDASGQIVEERYLW